MQWTAKNPITAGTIYSSAGWKWDGSIYKREEQLTTDKEMVKKRSYKESRKN